MRFRLFNSLASAMTHCMTQHSSALAIHLSICKISLNIFHCFILICARSNCLAWMFYQVNISEESIWTLHCLWRSLCGPEHILQKRYIQFGSVHKNGSRGFLLYFLFILLPLITLVIRVKRRSKVILVLVTVASHHSIIPRSFQTFTDAVRKFPTSIHQRWQWRFNTQLHND